VLLLPAIEEVVKWYEYVGYSRPSASIPCCLSLVAFSISRCVAGGTREHMCGPDFIKIFS